MDSNTTETITKFQQEHPRSFSYTPGVHVWGEYGDAEFTGVIADYRWDTTRRDVILITVALEDTRSLNKHGFQYAEGDRLIVALNGTTGWPADGFTGHQLRETGTPVYASDLANLGVTLLADR